MPSRYDSVWKDGEETPTRVLVVDFLRGTGQWAGRQGPPPVVSVARIAEAVGRPRGGVSAMLRKCDGRYVRRAPEAGRGFYRALREGEKIGVWGRIRDQHGAWAANRYLSQWETPRRQALHRVRGSSGVP